MRIAVVHLSDIHFQVHSNPIISRAEKIVAALRPVLQDVGGVVFAVTGDVAFSGMKEEYEVASGFLISLRDATTQTDPHMPMEFVFIPGNHDCNFRSEGDARPALLEGVAAKIDALDPSGEATPHLRFALLHNRVNWLEANNARLLRDHLDSCSDAILSGHEHVSSAYTKSRLDGARG